MSNSKRQRFTPRLRTTVPLTGTSRRTPLQLDHASDLALACALERLRRAGALKVPASGVVRRAIQFYAGHLEAAEDPASEFRAVSSACRALTPDADDRQRAWERLQAVPGGEPLPPYRELLRGPHAGFNVDELTARAEALAADILKQLPGRRRRMTTTTE